MDRLVLKRKPIRQAFTVTYKTLSEHLRKGESEFDIETINFNSIKLERLSSELELLNDQIISLILDEKDESKLGKEYEEQEAYKDKLDSVKVKIEVLRNKPTGLNNNPALSNCSSPNLSKKLRLPKIELKQFGGEIRDWLSFWSQFKRIHNDTGLEAEDKFQYLIQATTKGSRARDIVEGFPATASNYEKAIEVLKNRFGRDELLIEHYVRELLSLVVKNASSNIKINMTYLYDKLESHLRALESIGVTRDKNEAMLLPLVESCIPEDILRAWLRSPNSKVHDGSCTDNHSSNNRLQRLLSFLKSEVEGEERISMARAGFKGVDQQTQEKKYQSSEDSGSLPTTASNLFSGEKGFSDRPSNYKPLSLACVFCDKPHESRDCFNAQKMHMSQKRDILSKKKACFLCLKVGHQSKFCKSSLKCIVCGKTHLTIMCSNLSINEVNSKPTESKIGSTNKFELKGRDEQQSTNLTSQSKFDKQQVLLQTLQVNIGEKACGRPRTIRALIDSGSQRTYILEKTANELGCSPVGEKTLIHTLFGGLNSNKRVHRCYEINVSSLIGDYKCNLSVLDQPTICSPLPRLAYGPWIEELKRKNIMLTDIGEDQPEIELLIGADTLGNLLTGKTYKLINGLVAVHTLLGWTVMGRWPMIENVGKQTNSYGSLVTSMFIQTEQIPDLWSLDVLGITDPYKIKTKEENEVAAMQHFKDTVKINADGRYEVRLPWVEDRKNLESNKYAADKRLKSATLKLLSENKLKDYDSVFNFWESAGIIEQINESHSDSNTGYYLPHRAVIKEQSNTKIRPVFDASSKAKGAFSLNDCLEKGPNFIDLTPSVLTRFREKNIGVTSDIEKAFLQIAVNKSDCDYLKFLWWDNYKENTVKVFQHCRVVFGVNCSPFLLNATIMHHLDRYSSEFPITAEKLKKSFYVDNCVTSVDKESELHQFVEESSRIMSYAKFNLRDWRSSNDDIVDKEDQIGVLGLLWDKKKDQIYCNIPHVKIQTSVTRRNILSIVQKIFDPIGILCPVTLYPKLLLQESWKIKLSWDSTVPIDIENKFLRWLEGLNNLSKVRIPRQVTLKSKLQQSFSLHIFCDASKLAFSAVVFLRSEAGEDVNVQLLMAKSRIAPLKPMTIPRLELMACNIGARLGKTVKDSLDLKNVMCYYWTDSTTALYWIMNNEPWGTFVYNRVKEIRSISDNWLHIPGHLNPADLPSRGCTTDKLLTSLWWEGPNWLKLKEEQWPKGELGYSNEEVYLERKKTVETTLLNSSSTEHEWYLAYFSKYSKIIRMVAWMLRFVSNARKEVNDRLKGELTVNEIISAEKVVLKQVQSESFSGVNKSKLKTLCTFEDTNGIIRVKTKLSSLKEEDTNFKYPIVLPNTHQLVQLLIWHQHISLAHAGLNVLMIKLREQFWVLQSRRTIRKVISKCVKCRRFAAKPIMTEPVSLPEDRIRDAAVFEVTGVDLAGPLFLKDGSKTWITVYTCAVYRAIHLELITSLSTNGFLLGFRRFVARRGRPKTVYSDNGTNFIGANHLFKNIDWKYIERESSVSRIQWKFIPPTAAWWGGWWERIVQMVKNLLRRVLGRASLGYEELSSVLCDSEAVINSRPLTYISEEPDGITPLSPMMFLQDNLVTGVPDLDLLNSRSLTKRLRHQQSLRNQLRKRFKAEYLSQLSLRPNKGSNNNEIKENDVVIVGSDNSKRLNWPLARVMKLYPGKDGVVRVVKLKTETTELTRPVQRLYPLEVSSPANVMAHEEKDVMKKVNEPHTQKVTSSRGRVIKLPVKLMNYEL